MSGVVMEELTAKAYAKNDNSLMAVRSDLREEQAGNAVAVAKGQPGLIRAVNKTINRVEKKNLINKEYLPEAAKYMKTAQKSNTMAKYAPYFVKGIGYTIVITIFSVLIGIILGMLLALMRLSKNKLLHGIAVCYIDLFVVLRKWFKFIRLLRCWDSYF